MTVQEAIKYLQITKDCAEDESVGELQKTNVRYGYSGVGKANPEKT